MVHRHGPTTWSNDMGNGYDVSIMEAIMAWRESSLAVEDRRQIHGRVRKAGRDDLARAVNRLTVAVSGQAVLSVHPATGNTEGPAKGLSAVRGARPVSIQTTAGDAIRGVSRPGAGPRFPRARPTWATGPTMLPNCRRSGPGPRTSPETLSRRPGPRGEPSPGSDLQPGCAERASSPPDR